MKIEILTEKNPYGPGWIARVPDTKIKVEGKTSKEAQSEAEKAVRNILSACRHLHQILWHHEGNPVLVVCSPDGSYGVHVLRGRGSNISTSYGPWNTFEEALAGAREWFPADPLSKECP